MHTVYDPEKLKIALGELGFIAPEKIEAAYSRSVAKQIPFDEALLQDDLITDKDLGRTIAETIGVPYARIGEKGTTQALLTMLPETFSRRHSAVIFEDNPDSVSVASSNPLDLKMIETVSKKTQKRGTAC